MSSLAAAQADGYYIPPEYDGASSKQSISTHNTNGQFSGSNQFQRNGVVRFELPISGWCSRCKRHVGKGIRFNAKKVASGKYFTSTVWRFVMTCPSCPEEFIVDTDPQNASYKYISGITAAAATDTDTESDIATAGSGAEAGICNDDEHGVFNSVKEIERNNHQTALERGRKDPISRLSRDVWLHDQNLKERAFIASIQAVTTANSRADYDNNAVLRRVQRLKRGDAALLKQEGRDRCVCVSVRVRLCIWRTRASTFAYMLH